MRHENNDVGTMPTCHCLTLICCQPCLPNFQCFQSCIMNTLLHFLLLCQSRRSLRNVSYGGRVRLDQMCFSRLAEYNDFNRGAPFLVLPRAPPILNPPLRQNIRKFFQRTCVTFPNLQYCLDDIWELYC